LWITSFSQEESGKMLFTGLLNGDRKAGIPTATRANQPAFRRAAGCTIDRSVRCAKADRPLPC
jgi:hypothetical protein